jgi:hypothetical protein
VKLQLSLLTCGSCGKPRGRHHACAGRRGKRDRVGLRVRFTCPTCKREMRNPFTHTCTVRTDFARRRRAAERRAKAAARRERRKRQQAEAARRRKAAAAERRRKATAARRARRPRAKPHNPATCQDPECTRYGCVKYREGYDDGFGAAMEGADTA